MPTHTTYTEQATAKLNLCLAVKFPPTKDGYHQLGSIFQEIDLCDTLHFETRTRDENIDEKSEPDVCSADSAKSIVNSVQSLQATQPEICSSKSSIAEQGAASHYQKGITKQGTAIFLNCPPINIPVENNLIFKAFDALEQAHGFPIVACTQALYIDVKKHIPAGGGLGGGSSNAAACIRVFSKIHNIDLLCEKNLHVAQSLGADVAFFLHGGTALMEGRGDVLTRKLQRFPLPLVLMGSCESCSTGHVYKTFDEHPLPAPDAQNLADAIESYGEAESPLAQAIAASFLAKQCCNNLQEAAFETLPSLRQRINQALSCEGVLNALVTGSGATSYAIVASEELAHEFAAKAQNFCDWVRVVHAL